MSTTAKAALEPSPVEEEDPESTGPRIHQVREYELCAIPLSDLLVDGALDLDPSVVGKGYFDVRLKRHSMQLRAGGWVGLIPLNERVILDIRPRAPIASIVRLLRIAGYTPISLEHFARDYAKTDEHLESLRDLFAAALLNAVQEVQFLGRIKQYERREDRSSAPRGRILMNAWETRWGEATGMPVVRSTWFERTDDTPENRCLKFALWFLAQRYSRLGSDKPAREMMARLNRAYQSFPGVSLDRGLRFIDDRVVTGRAALPNNRAYYRPALDIALTIIRQLALQLEHPGADVTLPSIILNLATAFEDYAREVLRRELAHDDFEVLHGEQDGAKQLFDAGKTEATPDIVLRSRHLQPGDALYPVLLDVKYKPHDKDPDRGDINQVVTYAASYRCPAVVLVHPRGHTPDAPIGLLPVGDMGSLRVYQFVMDLSAADLEAEEATFGDAIRKLAQNVGAPLTL